MRCSSTAKMTYDSESLTCLSRYNWLDLAEMNIRNSSDPRLVRNQSYTDSPPTNPGLVQPPKKLSCLWELSSTQVVNPVVPVIVSSSKPIA
ncbi:hypothetical protein HW555_002240 [Spodoptera exigua]|uniref:Uncharacterized protein n=1 Tax=Spodoptera exigua TaxID=7107 RepID=A0A835GQ59_SPOEX|nr:hypothetical protein HW555_002240 [Spodoptera exigua]